MNAPRQKRLADRVTGLRPSLYARVLSRLQEYGGEVFPFHIGETYLLPAPQVQDALRRAADKEVHRYGHPHGLPFLRESIAHDLRMRALPCETDDVVVTHGATHGLSLACQAILDPGDEVLVLSPHWPLINGMIHTACAIPIEVPFTCRLKEGADARTLLEERITPKTRAIYVTSPNNPDGAVLTREQLEAIADVCIEHNLYALADEAYERFLFTERTPWLSQVREEMKERTIHIFTFSKSHRMTGLRVGFTVSPPDVRAAMVRLANFSIYNVSLLTQHAAITAIRDCQEQVDETVDAARVNRSLFCDSMSELPDLNIVKPDGGAYVFVDLSTLIGERDVFELLDHCLDAGVVFAPGVGFGAVYRKWARFCYTAMAPEHLQRGTDRLKEIINAFAKNAR